MISKKGAKVTKGMIFAGCSYTWGQGLYYYSNLETLRDQVNPWGYTRWIANPTHHKFKEKARYPRIVADHFKSFEIVHPQNGGANDAIVEYWKNCFTNRDKNTELLTEAHGDVPAKIEQIEYKEVSHVIFQMTQWMRDLYEIEYEGEKIKLPMQWFWDNNPSRDRPYRDILEKYLEKIGRKFGDLNEYLQDRSLKNVKRFLMECEENEIKTYILSWPHEFIQLIEKDPWLNERWITFNYGEKNYECIEHMNLDNPEFEIYKDYDNFKTPPQDSHPSLKCNQIIAENIINFIKNKENNGS
jgi:hypothetical protein